MIFRWSLAGLFVATWGNAHWARAQSTPVTAGYRDFNFGAVISSEPTLGKSQSKLWWNDGLWWGILWNPSTNRHEIYRFEVAAQSWTSTNTAVDIRDGSRADALWDGQRLYIVSQIYASTPAPTTSANAGRLYRFSYNSASKLYSLDAGFPVDVNNSKSEALTLDKDSTGKLWVTWVENNKVMLNRSLGNDLTWGTPFILPVQGNDTDPDDISTLVAFGENRLGVMWSNQKDSSNYFAVHLDGNADEVWQTRETALSGVGLGAVSEDHLNLKASCDGAGNLYAAALTNFSGAQSTSIFVLKRSLSGVWTRSSFAAANLDHSRPVLLINNENQRLYVIARSTETGPGNIYMKSASLNDLIFPAGLGTPIIQSATDLNITNPASTKQCLTNATGMLILAADKGSRYYLHSYTDLVSNAPKITSFFPASGPVGTPVTITGSQFTGTTKITFNGTPVTNFTINSDTQLSTTVPAGATNGKIIVVNAFDAASSSTDYFVTAPPMIASFTPADGPVGTQVTITGNSFISVTNVAFNGMPATSVIIDSNTQLRANVPTGATTGKISVTNTDGAALSANIFTVTVPPIISSFFPIRAVAGTEITITGNHFAGATDVGFNGKPATFTLDSNTQLRAKVPVDASTGTISIINSAGTGVSSTNFTMQHTLTLTYVGSGSVALNPPGGVYDQDAMVTLTAVPASGWEFNDWDGDLEGDNPTSMIAMDSDKNVIAEFHAIAQLNVTINVIGSGTVTIDPPGGIYLAGTTVTLIATPADGYVFSGYSGDFKGWMLAETMRIDSNKNLTATFFPLPTPRNPNGIWTSAAEISQLPTSGFSWSNLKAGADKPMGAPNLSDQEDSVNVAILAKALVFARTGDESYRQAVISACLAAIGTEQNGETLALGRELLAYVIAADLVGLPANEDAVFRNWLRNVLAEDLFGQTLRSSHERRPNNWGTHCGASRAAIARYLGDATELERTARVFKGWLGDRNSYADFSYGELDWQANPAAPVGINPLGAMLNGHSVDGVLPDDQRRAGGFTWPPPKENYVYGALLGALAQAVILYRAGYEVWNWQDQALHRAFKWLYNEANFPANGDDEWLLHIVNHYYKTNFPAPIPARSGKNAGWTDWLYGSPFVLAVNDDDNGEIEVHSLGVNNNNLTILKLTALPDAGYFFFNWSGDLSGSKNPDTLVMNAGKSVTANFLKSGPFAVAVTPVGSGTVALNPPGGVYSGGTVVTLTATPAAGFKFIGWSGDLTGATNPATLMITANQNIVATFKAAYDLTVSVAGSGTVALNPPTGPYEVGTTVKLTATPAAGYLFVEWSGALSGAANPATLFMNNNKKVTATFTAIRVAHQETRTGGSSSSAIVTTSTSLTGADSQLYLATITTRPKVKVNSVSGLGLDWTLVKAQCSGRNNLGIELWMAQGTPAANGAVTANLVSAPYNAVIAVSRYSGAKTITPLGDIVSGNTKGLDGPCAGGTDNTSYSFNVNTMANGSLVYGLVGFRNRTHTPGISYAERAEFKQGSAGSSIALAVEDKVFPASGLATVNGTFSGSTDWAMVAVEIKPPASSASPDDFSDEDSSADPRAPLAFQLHQNYPNPFNLQTNIEYVLPQETSVRLFIYNLYGQKIRTLVDGIQSAGRNLVQWNGSDDNDLTMSSGIYLIYFEAGAQRLTRRIILLK